VSWRPSCSPAAAAAIAAVAAVLLVAVSSQRGRPAADGSRGAATQPTAAPSGGPPTAAQLALARRAQGLVDVRPAELGYRLAVRAARPGVRGATDRATRPITLYVDEREAAHRVAHDLAHELGHAYDDRRMDAAARARWLRERGARAPWSPGGARSDYETGAGDFAEVFARCHAASSEFRSRLAPPPADACALLPAGARSIR
jgi:hypothetical protein